MNTTLNKQSIEEKHSRLKETSCRTARFQNRGKLCTVQQVEDLKTLIRILPLWSSSILVSTPIGIQGSLTVLQALTTHRHLSHRFQIPAGSMIVFTLISTAISLTLFDHFLWPMWNRVAGKNPTSLQQIGIGHAFNIASMAVSAIVESKRWAAATAHHLQGGPMSVLWLVPQLVIVGIGEAFHFAGQVALYYQEFPTCLKSMATAMVAMQIGVAYYLSTAVVDFVRRVTEWLPDDIDDGRVDNVHWLLVVIGVLNFGYYLGYLSCDNGDDFVLKSILLGGLYEVASIKKLWKGFWFWKKLIINSER
ncbi:UNVERIFIED_CONTAM: Protein NRT1/ PTR FAMILY 2.6 [Sesamum indicum]